jgi:hypothetical protein
METAVSVNGRTGNLLLGQPLLSQYSENSSHIRLTVQQALSKWYGFLKAANSRTESTASLFEDFKITGTLKSLQADLKIIPELLMDELINNDAISDKRQYIRLVQALLINLSDILPESEMHEQLCDEAETVLQFMQNFLYQYYDFDFKLSMFYLKHLQNSISLKLEYWKIKLFQSPIIDVLQECINEKFTSPENYLTFRKVNYLKNIFRQIESSTYIINEAYIRQLFFNNNFNAAGFIDYEINLIKNKLIDENSVAENIALLKAEQFQISQLKERSAAGYELNHPSVKKQLTDWVIEKIKQEELSNLKGKDKDLQIDPESKIQTSLSVAKLAVLIRLLVADKIIINKSVAPMLRTVAKLFTTLQKDEISFGSLETKYHAPDKATLNIMKEMLQKWGAMVGKL